MIASETPNTRLEDAPQLPSDLRGLDRASPVPLYHQIYGTILHGIRDGRLPVGSSLPTEAELGGRFGVSRITIRQALADLVRDGHLVRERPRGPLIIKSAPIEQRLARLTEFFIADALAQGHDPRFVFLGARRSGADDQSIPLEIDVSDTVTRIERLLVDRGGPLALLNSYIPERCCPDLIAHDLSGSIVPVLESAYGLRMVSAVQRISARLATEGERNPLGLEPRAAVVVIKRLSRAADGEPLEFLECVLRADRYEFVMELSQEERRHPETRDGAYGR
jgi:GntR family transcriptional regulator